MSRSRFGWSIFLGLVTLITLAHHAAAEEDGRHFLWKATNGESTVYLMGSIHLVQEGIYPLPDVVYESLESSDVVVFEADLSTMEVELQSLMSRGFFDEGKTIGDVLSEETFGRVKEIAEKHGLPMEQLQRMKPWLLSITLTVLELQKAGYASVPGIDMHLHSKAGELGKEFSAVETVEQQISLLDGLGEEDQDKMMRHSLDELHRLTSMFDELLGLWRTGDAEAMERLLNEELRQVSESLYKSFVVDRNQAWIGKLSKLSQEGKTVMMVAGAAHMVGEDGLVKLHEKLGYEIEQL